MGSIKFDIAFWKWLQEKTRKQFEKEERKRQPAYLYIDTEFPVQPENEPEDINRGFEPEIDYSIESTIN